MPKSKTTSGIASKHSVETVKHKNLEYLWKATPVLRNCKTPGNQISEKSNVAHSFVFCSSYVAHEELQKFKNLL